MSTTFYQNISNGTLASAKGTLASLASSATAGRQGATVTFVDGNNRVPEFIFGRFRAKLVNSGSVANDKAVYLWLAESWDGTNFSSGPPTVGASDAAFTFTNSPQTNPTGLRLVCALGYVSNNESQERTFIIQRPPRKAVFVVQNYSGLALSSTESDHIVEYGSGYTEGV